MTGYATKEKALEAIKLGAYDFFAKPFSLAEMEVVIRRALERRELKDELDRLKSALVAGGGSTIVGQSLPMLIFLIILSCCAPRDASLTARERWQ